MSFVELSRKQQLELNFDFTKLGECCMERGRAITAAEFAEFLGIARSTAARRLVNLVTMEMCQTYRQTGRNRYPKITYEPNGNGQTWDYTYGWYGADESEE